MIIRKTRCSKVQNGFIEAVSLCDGVHVISRRYKNGFDAFIL